MRMPIGWKLGAVALLIGVAGAEIPAQGKSEAKTAASGQARAQPQAQGRAPQSARADARLAQGSAAVTVVFRAGDREAFERYFTTHNMRAKPLPPGMRKRLAKGKPLPPGIAKQVLPNDLMRIAPPVGKDIEFGIVGDAVVATRAGLVIDILAAVLK